MIYDCFLFFNELELLELRLIELWDVVDKFVLVESTRSFRDHQKNLYYLDNKHLYDKYNQKIIHVIVEDAPNGLPPTQETFLRNSIIRGLKNCNDDDIIMLSDLDEIPNKNILSEKSTFFEINKSPICLRMPLFYYYINCLMVDVTWFGTIITDYKTFKTKTAQYFRDLRDKCKLIDNAGWHFSYLYGIDRMIQKIQNLSDPVNIEKATRPEWLKKCLEELIDPYERPYKFKIIPLDSSFPETIIKNPSKYPIYHMKA